MTAPRPEVYAPLHLRELLPEREISKLWRSRTRRLWTLDGRRLEVLYAGRPAPGHGPDFRDAVLRLDGDRLHGDVEVHRRPSGWQEHGHDRDPAYAGVVLHVVGATGDGGPPGVPTVVLSAAAKETRTAAVGRVRPKAAGPLPALERLTPRARSMRLRRAGLAWLEARTERAARVVEAKGVEQALYAALMEGLGYVENRAAFRELAELLPIRLLRAAGRVCPPAERAELFRGLLLGGAGLEPLTPAWHGIVGREPLLASVWHTSGLRPASRPERRMSAAAALVARHQGSGLAAGLERALRAGRKPLLDALRIRDPGGAIGEGHARLLLVNAVLPTLRVAANLRGDRTLARVSADAFESLPALPANTLTREAARLVGPSLALGRLTACEGQGLLQLYRESVSA